MGVFTLTHDARQVMQRMHALPAGVNRHIAAQVRGALLVQETRVRQRAGIKFRRGGAGLSGRLTSYARIAADGQLDAAIGFRKTALFPYELSQEFGAKAGSGALPVPVSPQARALSHRGLGPRQMSVDLHIRKIGGRAFLVEFLRRKVVTHYVLVKSIEGRLNFRQTMAGATGDLSAAIVRGFQAGAAAHA